MIEPVKKGLTKSPEPAKVPTNVGEMHLTLTDDEMLDVKIIRLGRLTPGRIEKAQNFLYMALMRARAAEEIGKPIPDFRFHVGTSIE